jgi:hypothetical protein
MSVYVDSMTPCAKNSRWNYSSSCHMFADSDDELHAMADAIGLKRAWFQNHRLLPHYDLVSSKRAQAVRLGAIEVDYQFVGARLESIRQAKKEAEV